VPLQAHLRRQNADKKNRRRRALLPDRVIKSPHALELLPGIYRNTRWGKHYQRTFCELVTDRGGIDNCSSSQIILARSVSAIETEIYLRICRLSENSEPSPDREIGTFKALVETLRRSLEGLGLQRSAKEIPGQIIDGTMTIDENKPDPVIEKVMHKAFKENDSPALLALFRAQQQKSRDEEEDPVMRVFEVSK
jgi:hypothetical protein